jgi:FKBP-type peptidyl-prolyl cis-trans isomerase SlyD
MSETVADGFIVSIKYTLTDSDGDVLDSSAEGPPLSYLHGAGNIVPGLERELTGKKVGDRVEVVVLPADGYGERHEPPPQSVPLSAFPDDAELEQGLQIFAQGPSGDPIPLWVVELDDEEVLLDHNHPLAGVTLNFSVEVMEIQAASEDEKRHGHPHGPGGHQHHN